MPYSEIIRELEARRVELEAEVAATEARLAEMKGTQAENGVTDDTRILARPEPLNGDMQPV